MKLTISKCYKKSELFNEKRGKNKSRQLLVSGFGIRQNVSKPSNGSAYANIVLSGVLIYASMHIHITHIKYQSQPFALRKAYFSFGVSFASLPQSGEVFYPQRIALRITPKPFLPPD
jgi:hypothetical protein